MEYNKKALTLFCFGLISILLIQYLVRPAWLEAPSFLRFLMNVYPSLASGILIPLCFLIFEGPFFYLIQTIALKLTSFLGLVASLGYEFLQMAPLFNKTFDFFDVLATLTGITLGYFITLTTLKAQEKRELQLSISSVQAG